MTQHDFVLGPSTANAERSFICTLCQRTTTTPETPHESCWGPPTRGADRIAFLQLVELRVIANLMQARAAELYPPPRPLLEEMASALRDKAAAERESRK